MTSPPGFLVKYMTYTFFDFEPLFGSSNENFDVIES